MRTVVLLAALVITAVAHADQSITIALNPLTIERQLSNQTIRYRPCVYSGYPGEYRSDLGPVIRDFGAGGIVTNFGRDATIIYPDLGIMFEPVNVASSVVEDIRYVPTVLFYRRSSRVHETGRPFEGSIPEWIEPLASREEFIDTLLQHATNIEIEDSYASGSVGQSTVIGFFSSADNNLVATQFRCGP